MWNIYIIIYRFSLVYEFQLKSVYERFNNNLMFMVCHQYDSAGVVYITRILYLYQHAVTLGTISTDSFIGAISTDSYIRSYING